MKNNLLDIIIIGKNEEKVLAKTFTSVNEAVRLFYGEYESKPNIIYIDSNSTDNSINIAKEFNIDYKIITGKASPAIGRIEGVKHTNSKYIFFLDGDTEVEKEWLIKSVKFLEENEKIAGVGGELIFNFFDTSGKLILKNKKHWNIKKNVENIYDGVGGTFLYKRDAYIKGGGFSSEYRIHEEFELMLRIIALGYKVKRLNIPMAIHNDYKIESIGFIKRYLFTKDIFILGKVCKNSLHNKETLKIIFIRFWLYIIHLPLLLLIISFLLAGLYITSSLLVLGLIISHFVVKQFNIKRTIISLFSMNFYSFGLYLGLLK